MVESNLRKTVVKGRYRKLLEIAIDKITYVERRTIIEDILTSLSARHYNKIKNSNTYHSHVMYNLLRSQNLREIFKNNWSELFKLYKNIHEFYKDFHLYWLHRAISEIKYKLYDDAEIHLAQAEALRANSFEIKHTIAVLYLEKSLHDEKLNFSQKNDYFKKGIEILQYQIDKVSNDAYSFHTYVVRSCLYYSQNNIVPYKDELKRMVSYYREAKNKFSLDSVIVRNMLKVTYDFLTNINYRGLLSLNQDEMIYLKKATRNIDALDQF